MAAAASSAPPPHLVGTAVHLLAPRARLTDVVFGAPHGVIRAPGAARATYCVERLDGGRVEVPHDRVLPVFRNDDVVVLPDGRMGTPSGASWDVRPHGVTLFVWTGEAEVEADLIQLRLAAPRDPGAVLARLRTPSRPSGRWADRLCALLRKRIPCGLIASG